MSLSALTLRFACDQTSRAPLSPYDGVDAQKIYLGNPVNIQVALFSNAPSELTLITDLASNVTLFSLIIRKVNSAGELICQKDIDIATASLGNFNGDLTWSDWLAATSQHIQFQLGVLDTNVEVPSCGQLEYYAGIAANTSSGPILVGFFKGYLIDDGVAVWIIGVMASGAPVLFFRLIDAYVESTTSLESIQGNVLSNNSVVKCVIDSSNSEWLVVKPATRSTDVAAGVIRLLDGTAHLERIEGL